MLAQQDDTPVEDLIPTPSELDREMGDRPEVKEAVRRIVGVMRSKGTTNPFPASSGEYEIREILQSLFHRKGWELGFNEVPPVGRGGYQVKITPRGTLG